MTYTITRILSATVLGALVTGCATVPGDPYYDSPRYPVYEQPGYIYSAPPPVYQAPPVYRAPGVIYSAPPPPPAVYYGGRDRDDNRWDNDRNRNDWRERERDRDRAERDRAAREREAATSRPVNWIAEPENRIRPAGSRPNGIAALPKTAATAKTAPPPGTRQLHPESVRLALAPAVQQPGQAVMAWR